jgi:Arm DNA-binding domain
MPRRALRKLNLTELYVRKVKPEAAAFVVWDARQHGLAMRVQPGGSKAWKCIYSRHGRPRWLHIGDAGAIGLSDARTLAAEAMLAVARGHDPAAEKKAERSKGTFAELAERYVEQWAKRHNKSWRQADALVRRHALPRWGKLQAATITRSDIKTMMASIEAPIVANQTLAAVSAIFSWGVKDELVAGNPCKLVDRNATRSRERILADSEIPQFWSAFDDGGLVAGSALRLILLSGQRPGEVAHMRHEHIKDCWWTMPGAPEPALGWAGYQERRKSPCVAPCPGAGHCGRDGRERHGLRLWARGHQARRCHALDLRQARRRARDPARFEKNLQHDRHRLGVRPRRLEPRHQSQGGWDRQRL